MFPPNPHCFFFSYSHDDLYAVGGSESALEKFFVDLQLEVSQQIGGGTAWRDADMIRTGDVWSVSLQNAVKTAKSIVCVCSESYFRSPWCSRELAVFQLRHKFLQEADAKTAYIPVIWRRSAKIETIPEFIRAIQTSDQDMPPTYRQFGLLELARKGRFRDDYLSTVNILAKRVIEAVGLGLPHADQWLDLGSLDGAFSVDPTGTAQQESPSLTSTAELRGPQCCSICLCRPDIR